MEAVLQLRAYVLKRSRPTSGSVDLGGRFGMVFVQLSRYQGPPVNLARGYPNLAHLSMTAQFYRQDALTAPNLAHPDANLAHLCTTLQRQQEKHHTPPASCTLFFLAVTAVSCAIVPGLVPGGSGNVR